MAPHVRLVVYSREEEVISHLDRLGVPYTTEQMHIGDFHVLIDDRVELIIERKAASDYAASIKDGRWREQRLRLHQSNIRLWYVIEGFFDSLEEAGPASAVEKGRAKKARVGGDLPPAILSAARASSVWAARAPADPDNVEGLFYNGILWTSLQSGLERAMLRAEQVKVHHTRSVRGTAEFLKRLLDHNALLLTAQERQLGQAGDSAAEARERYQTQGGIHMSKKANMDPETCYIAQLSQVPGVSPVVARGIKGQWANMPALVKAMGVQARRDSWRRAKGNKAGRKRTLAWLADTNITASRRVGPAAAEKLCRFVGGWSTDSDEDAEPAPVVKQRRIRLVVDDED